MTNKKGTADTDLLHSERTYNIGMYGTGYIACQIAYAIDNVEGLTKYGVASRHYENAQNYAKQFQFTKIYLSYEEMLNDPNLDVVYVATPTGEHYKCIKNCLNAGKHVICEKPFCTNKKECLELFEIAKSKKLVVMDAMWSLYMPMWKKLRDFMDSTYWGGIKNTKLISLSFSYPKLNSARLMEPKGGGAFLDLGVYCVAGIEYLTGEKLDDLHSEFKYLNGVDIKNDVVAMCDDCKIIIHSGIEKRNTYLMIITGKDGIIIGRKFWLGRGFVYIGKKGIRIYKFDNSKGYEYELEECVNILDRKSLESEIYPHIHTLNVFEMMDTIRKESKKRI